MNPDSSLRSELVRNLVRVNGAALFVQVWEWAITLDDEVEYIWSKPKSSWVKWVFLFLRYFTFVTQFVNRSVDMAVLYDFPLRPSAIKVYYIVGVIVAQLAMAGVESVMMVRVYALYGRSKYVKFSFIFLLFAGFATMIVGLVLNIPEDNFKPTSIMVSAPASFAYFGVAALVSQVAILALSAMRWRPGSSAPVMRMFMFDGMLAFISISIVSTVLTICTLLRLSSTATSYAWLLCLVSSAGCRLILNIQRQSEPRYPSARTSSTPQFTTMYTPWSSSSQA